LDYYANETVYTFEGIDQPYTLTFDYSVKPQFVSEQCGHRFVLENLSVASTGFDSIRLITTTPHGRFSSGVTVEVYRCPNTSRLKIHFAEPVGISNIATDYPATILLTSQSVSSMLLPLNADASQSTIDFAFSDGTTKRLVIGYKNEQHTLFKTCGPQQVLSEFNIVETDFTSVSVLKTTIEDPNKTNLEIVL
jgi:hypothetical protein